jgi:hypothetical protein
LAKKPSSTQEETKPVKKAEPTEVKEPAFIANQPILKKFEDKGGILDLIKAAKAAVKLYENEKLRNMWTLWLSEIESFS